VDRAFWLKQLRLAYYFVAFACVLYSVSRFCFELNSATNAAAWATYQRFPPTTTQSLRETIKEFRFAIRDDKIKTAKDYFQYLGKLENLENSAHRMQYDPAPGKNWFAPDSLLIREAINNIDTTKIREKVVNQNPQGWEEAVKTYQASRPKISHVKENYSNTWPWLFGGYFALVFFIFGHNCMVLKRNKCSIIREMMRSDSLEFWYSPFTIIGVFQYPYDVHPLDQIRYACRLLLRVGSLLVSTVVAIAAHAGTLCKKIEPREGGDQQTAEDCYRIDISTRTKSQYFGTFVKDIFFDGWVQQTSVTFSIPRARNAFFRGLSLNLWNSSVPNTRPFGSGFGSEQDLALNWSGKISGINIIAGVTYLDVYPLRRLARGDVVNASLTMNKSYALGKYFAVTPYLFNVVAGPVKGSTPNGGWITQSGIALQYKPAQWLTFTTSPHAVHDSGAFGEKEGYLFGQNGDFAIQVSKHFSLHPIEINAGTPIRVKDSRRPHVIFGFGLDYSFGF